MVQYCSTFDRVGTFLEEEVVVDSCASDVNVRETEEGLRQSLALLISLLSETKEFYF